MDKRTSIYVTIIAIVGLTAGMSCDNSDMTRSMERIEYAEKAVDSTATGDSISVYCSGGISFNLESDSLDEEIEEIYFHPKDWVEENINADL